MKKALLIILCLTTLGGLAQRRIGHYSAYQIDSGEVIVQDLTLYWPKEPIRVPGSVWMIYKPNVVPNEILLLEFTKYHRRKVHAILGAYQELIEAIETPDKLPSSMPLGQIDARLAFGVKGNIHLDEHQIVLFYLKFNRAGEKSLAMAIGELTSKQHPNTTRNVPLLWYDEEKVAAFKKVISDENIERFIRYKDEPIHHEILDALNDQ